MAAGWEEFQKRFGKEPADPAVGPFRAANPEAGKLGMLASLALAGLAFGLPAEIHDNEMGNCCQPSALSDPSNRFCNQE